MYGGVSSSDIFDSPQRGDLPGQCSPSENSSHQSFLMIRASDDDS